MSKEAICIGCGCTETDACINNEEQVTCEWAVRPDPIEKVGLCSNCVPIIALYHVGATPDISRREAERRRLERRIATNSAMASIEFAGVDISLYSDRPGVTGHWYSAPSDPDDRKDFDEACHYLELRGRLRRHPAWARLVRLIKVGS